MDLVFLQSVWTVVAFVFFVGVVIWAWSGRRKADFDKAARMALDDDMPASNEKEHSKQSS
ncbi:MAG TPA: cbb3-type cytochrome c oxidase subunit 3 [Thiotrichales bacterium]|nr:cbb3-type cytochrome c oxidase subunit 3 [Thiotrichales bacterium]